MSLDRGMNHAFLKDGGGIYLLTFPTTYRPYLSSFSPVSLPPTPSSLDVYCSMGH